MSMRAPKTKAKQWWISGHAPAAKGEWDPTLDDIFKSPPKITITGARVEDEWPVKTIEFDMQVLYNGITWETSLSKTNIYRIWFYIKSHGYLNAFNNLANGEEPPPPTSPPATPTHAPPVKAASSMFDMPQLRYFFFATHERSTGDEMLRLVETYLNTAFSIPKVRTSAFVLSLLQISAGTFDRDGRMTSRREGWLKVRCWLKGSQENVRVYRGAVACDNCCFNCLCVCKKVSYQTTHWKWVALKPCCLAIYSSNRETAPKEVLLFDAKFKVERGVRFVGSHKALVISNASFVLHVEARNRGDALKWANAIRRTMEASEWAQNHRDESFAIPRSLNARAQWFVDGQDAYAAIYDKLQQAKERIFIAGWWICPNTYLRRPTTEFPDARLDLLLQRKASDGVQIYVLMYKEVNIALTLDSMYSKKTLRGLHPNIHVLRDPDFIMKQWGMWSHHEKIVCIDERVAFVGGLDLCFGRWDTPAHALFDDDATTFPGKDYSNPRIKDFVKVNEPDVDLMDRRAHPRMPWHDCHCQLIGDPARDVGRHFVQRWNFSVSTRVKGHRFAHILPLASPPLPPPEPQSSTSSPKRRDLTRGFSRLGAVDEADDVPAVVASVLDEALGAGFNCACQVLRSISLWSGGCPTEKSIQNAYIRLINSASHFVYIENQFFVSGVEGDTLCQNRIANALVARILRAAAAKEPFRVMVVMPLLPAFQGTPEEKQAYSLRGVMHWQYRSICRGEGSIYRRLLKEIPDPFEYIAFYGLRTHAIHDGKPVTEEVYVHSKIMIVDDRACIIGRYFALHCLMNYGRASANINERSMNGDRDSEIAVVVEDTDMEPDVTIGDGAAVGKFAHSFRMKLFEEHFGVTPGSPLYAKYSDPVPAATWFAFQDQAMKNSMVYESVFGCLPADAVRSFGDMGVKYDLDKKERTGTFRRMSACATTTSAIVDSAMPAVIPEDMPEDETRAPTLPDTLEASFHGAPASGIQPSVALSDEGLSRGVSRREKESNGQVFTFAMTAMRCHEHVSVQRQRELDDVRGHVVYFPLRFLEAEDLEPKYYPAELFQ
ncbi:phospholipase D, Pi-PXPH-PLD [Achlya hypogyna]|uniref:Phospholipase n=1 Tax=Achlya hypogyna TaxID=1202772 RepID=A0A1V9YR81_ACHHY|nr:phospholipase D, Pi-PXPH-PLD [Achlya hypogyna]